jgi:NitT/TauT family transport system permease protein
MRVAPTTPDDPDVQERTTPIDAPPGATTPTTAGGGGGRSAGAVQVVLLPEKQRRITSERTIHRSMLVVAPLVAVALWEVLVRLAVLDDRFFPAPSSLGPAFLEVIEDGTLLSHVRATATRLVLGFVVGAIPGIALGLLLGVSKWARYSLQPLFSALYPIPKIAIFPLLVLIFGLGEPSKILVVALGVFFIVLFNTSAGVLAVPRILRDAGRNFGARGLFEFRTIALPGALPSIFTGLRLGMGTAMLVLVSAEFVGSQTGLGYMIWQSWQVFKVENLFIGLTAVAVVGYVMIQLIELLERVAIKWRY